MLKIKNKSVILQINSIGNKNLLLAPFTTTKFQPKSKSQIGFVSNL